MSQTSLSTRGSSDLRRQAIDRATALLQQLEADHADLLRFKDRTKQSEADEGLEAVKRVIEATRRLNAELQGG